VSTGSRDEGPRNQLHEWELFYPKGPGTGLSNVNVRNTRPRRLVKFNNRRLHGGITPGPGYTTPTNHKAD
jgi:hypothetical protein